MKDRDVDGTRLEALAQDVDRAFAGIQERRGDRMACRAGCSDCCRARLAVTRVEESWIRAGLAQLSESERAELARSARNPERESCPALDDRGRCRLYGWRPLICRMYGAPLRRRSEVALLNPPVTDACSLNFVEISLDSLPDEDVLEQTVLAARLDAIDDLYCERNGYPKGERIGIAAILEEASSEGEPR